MEATLPADAPYSIHGETHLVHRIGWLRAAVLGANDGVVSVASILTGVASSGIDHGAIVVSGVAGLVAGAMSMAAGEYVSVSSQSDTEKADLAREKSELETHSQTAHSVARQLMDKDALGAHARDELGITEVSSSNPIQAALTSALTFTAGALPPVLAAVIATGAAIAPAVAVVAVIVLIILGSLGARTGGASMLRGAIRVTFWGILAMAVTAGVGALFGTIAA
jgi:VIT1/CCC1 family predicted Fe2+/Mn2+ transporter